MGVRDCKMMTRPRTTRGRFLRLASGRALRTYAAYGRRVLAQEQYLFLPDRFSCKSLPNLRPFWGLLSPCRTLRQNQFPSVPPLLPSRCAFGMDGEAAAANLRAVPPPPPRSGAPHFLVNGQKLFEKLISDARNWRPVMMGLSMFAGGVHQAHIPSIVVSDKFISCLPCDRESVGFNLLGGTPPAVGHVNGDAHLKKLLGYYPPDKCAPAPWPSAASPTLRVAHAAPMFVLAQPTPRADPDRGGRGGRVPCAPRATTREARGEAGEASESFAVYPRWRSNP